MSYNYTGFVNELANLAGTNSAQPNFVIELPAAIDYGEQRIFRDLDLLANVTVDASTVTTPGNRGISPLGTFVAINAISIVTPAGAVGANGKRNPCVKVSQDVLDFLYPDASITGVPKFFCYLTQGYGGFPAGVVLGPWPDQVYSVIVSGTARPLPLSPTNQNTFLATSLPDLFLVACMIHMSAYQKNWSAAGSDPASAATYEAQYQKLLLGADAEEVRKRYSGTTVLPAPGTDKQPTTPDAKP